MGQEEVDTNSTVTPPAAKVLENQNAVVKTPVVKKRVKKKSIDRPSGTFSELNAINNLSVYITSSLKSLKEDPVYSNKTYPIANRVMSLVKDLEEHINSPAFLLFWENCIKMIWQVIMAGNSKKLKPGADELMCHAFYKYMTTSLGRWITLLDELHLNSKGPHVKTINQYLQRTLLKLVLNDKHKMDLPDEDTLEDPQLDKHTEQVIRYVAGYVPYALVKRFKKGKSRTAKAYCEVLSSWQVCSTSITHSFLAYTKEWIDRQNRSGLFTVDDDVYLFFRNLEIETMKYLSKDKFNAMIMSNHLGELVQKIISKRIVQTYWCRITRDTLGDDASRQLLDIVVKYWVKIRANAFLKVYLNLKKESGKVSKKGEKSLRKELM